MKQWTQLSFSDRRRRLECGDDRVRRVQELLQRRQQLRQMQKMSLTGVLWNAQSETLQHNFRKTL